MPTIYALTEVSCVGESGYVCCNVCLDLNSSTAVKLLMFLNVMYLTLHFCVEVTLN